MYTIISIIIWIIVSIVAGKREVKGFPLFAFLPSIGIFGLVLDGIALVSNIWPY